MEMLAHCSRCKGKIEVNEDIIIGDIIVCLDCGSPHIVKSISNGIAEVEYKEIEVFEEYYTYS